VEEGRRQRRVEGKGKEMTEGAEFPRELISP